MFKSDRERNLQFTGWAIHLAGVAALLSGIAGYEFVVETLIVREREQIALETAEKERFVARIDIIEEEFNHYSDRLTELRTNAGTMRQRIPEQPFEADFLRQISQVADQEGVKIVKYDRGSLQRKPTHSEFDVRLSCEGNYTAVCGFLDRLAKLSRVATVQTMTLTSNAEGVYPFDLSLLLYYAAQGGQRG
jgi:Tfp pilus assembly protein PilO